MNIATQPVLPSPAAGAGDDEVARLHARIAKLEKINAALMDRVERSSDMQGSAFSMFETAIALETMVRDRTQALEDAMALLATANAELAEANVVADAARLRLRDAIQSISEGFALFDADDRLVLYNEAYLGFWPEVADLVERAPRFHEIVRVIADRGLTVGARVAPDRWVSDRLARHSIAAGGHVQALADGRWVQINELRTSEGGIVGIYTDITEAKAEDARERARELGEKSVILQTTLDTIPQGVCVFDRERRLVAWNGPLLAVIGLPADGIGLIQTHAGLVETCTRHNGRMDDHRPLDWLSPGAPDAIARRHHANGRVIDVRRALMPDGGMVMSFTDITEALRSAEALERRVAERTAQMEEAKIAAEHANLSKTRFLAAASHDLLQPLNAARLFIAALADRKLALPTRALVNQTSTALDSVEDLLEALLEISRLDAGAIQPEFADFCLAGLLDTLRIEFAPLASAAGLDLRIEASGQWVRSDVRLVRRILQNFLSNAIRYTPRGEVRVRCTSGADGVRVSIDDTGPGIPLEKQSEIFEEFRRLDSSRRTPGKGLGLAIVRRASDMLRHPIALRSAPGEGSSFSILLPAGEALSDAAVAISPAMRTRSMRDLRVLVVDNEEQIQRGMQVLLGDWGCAVGVAKTVAEAVQSAAAVTPDIIIADFHLDDGETGDDAVQRVRQTVGRDIPAIIISADRSSELKARLDGQNMPLLGKPVKPAQLRALLRTVLG
ncbi:signal transduction histidine kinase [Sphingomonas zeicaulis]